MGIEDGGHWGESLAKSLSPEPRGLETIGQGHHNGTKFVFDIVLKRGKIVPHWYDLQAPTLPKALARPSTDSETLKKFRKIKDKDGELSKDE